MFKKYAFVSICVMLTLPALATPPDSSDFFVLPERAIKEPSKPKSEYPGLDKRVKEKSREWEESPEYRQYSEKKTDPITGEITYESYGIEF
ncbi:hypothetical protein U2T19_004872 [Salmonella enterica]|nr:hypothetical protein [Salmonella enterica]EGI1955501.1 hypothetical protein [Salmonella enterica]EMA3598525.1 hypothetical protein [Salmonella enterica]